MEINKIELQGLLDIALNQKINGTEAVFIPQILNLYKNNLKCLYADLYEFGKQMNSNLDTAKLSLELHKNLIKFTEDIHSSNTSTYYCRLPQFRTVY